MRGSSIASIALRRPVTVSMGLLALLVLGAISYARIPVQLMPTGYDFPFIWMWAPYRNASPQEVERQIVQPVEDALGTMPGLRRVESRAGSDYANWRMEFAQDTSMDEAWSNLVDRMERTMPELPEDFEQYYIWKYNPEDDPIMWMAVSLPDDEQDPAYVVETRIVKALERVPGVARVEFNGAARARIYIDFNREEVDRHNVSLYQVMNQLQADNFTMPSGDVTANGSTVLVRSIATFDEVETIRKLPIGKGLVLDDIAEVIHARPLDTTVHRVNGLEAAAMDIYKESGANTLEVTQALGETLDALGEQPELAGFQFHRFFDQGELIQESIDNLRNTAVQGGFLAVFVLFLFLRRTRITLLIAATIPMSMLMTLVLMYAQGETINLLSMMGMMLSVGMVVDNSIVVVESIYSRRERGDPPLRAALEGTAEVSLAILAGTLTTIVVFLPLITMSDDARFSFFMGRLGMPVCFALLSSLVVALVVVPLATTVVAGGEPAPPSRPILWLTRSYERTLDVLLRRRADAVIISLLLMGSGAWAADNLGRADEVSGGMVDVVVRMGFPASFSTAEMDEALTEVEDLLLSHSEDWNIKAVRTRRWRGSTRGFVMAFLNKRESEDLTKEDIAKVLEEELPEIPGVKVGLGWGGGGRGGGGNELNISLNGPDSEKLVELAEGIADRLRGVQGVIDVEPELDERGTDELVLRVDRTRAARYGVDPSVLARSVAFGFRGGTLRPVHIAGRDVPVQTGFRLQDRADIERLDAFSVWSPTGPVALSTVADKSFKKGYGQIRRVNRRTSLKVKVLLEGEDMMAARGKISSALSKVELPRGYTWNTGRRFEQMAEQDRARNLAMLLSIAYVFLLMGMLFESFWLPMSVLLSIPFAFFGVYWMLYVTGTTFEMMAGIGLVILVGIVVNNAIVLVDRVQQHRDNGLTRNEAILAGGRDRIRPILMTAATTIVGLLPMALGKSGLVGIPYYPLGRAVIGGLLASTLLSLLLVPLFYTFLDDLKGLLLRLMGWRAKPLPGEQTA
ncbi:MAG: efflux RND transporter permease subunit [Deltaproteobacteria bacterium]|nr:efflux RND transporter permease subunit [Deltaproteobacteria bacterium]